SSSLHSLRCPSPTLKLNSTVAPLVFLVATSSGRVMTGGGGGVVMIRHDHTAGEASTLPAWSMARTANVCEPSFKPLRVCGELQAVQAPASRRHSNRTPASSALKAKVADVAEVTDEGVEVR